MAEEFRIDQLVLRGVFRSVVDVSSLGEWVTLDLRFVAAPDGRSAHFGEGSQALFVIDGAPTPAWDFAKSPSAGLAVSRAAIAPYFDAPTDEFEIPSLSLRVFYNVGKPASTQNFALRLKLGSTQPALPEIAADFETKTIDLEAEATGREVEIVAFPFGTPEFPTLGRPATEVTVVVSVFEPTDSRAADVNAGLRVRLLKTGDRHAWQPLSSGATFELEYNERIRRFDPEGVVFALDVETMLRLAARTQLRQFTLGFEFFAKSKGKFGAARIVRHFRGEVANRLVVSGRGATASLTPTVHLLDGAAIRQPPARVTLERLPNKFFAPRSVSLALRVEPSSASLAIRARLDGRDLGPLAVLATPQGRGEWTVDAPIADWLRERDDDLTEALDLEFEIAIADEALEAPRTVRHRVTLAPAPPQPKWIACVDFGASTTAIWVGSAEAEMQGVTLALGGWLKRFEGGEARGAVNEADDDTLLPSDVGLSSDFHLRALFDPLSLGDLMLSLPGRDAAVRRLAAKRGATFDVSVPFPSRARLRRRYEGGKRPAYIQSIVHELKRAVVRRETSPRLAVPVLRRRPGADDGRPSFEDAMDVDVAELMQDVFAELGGYVAPSALKMEFETGQALSVARARLNGEPFIVAVTHPYGLGGDVAETYANAGRRFAEAFVPSLSAEGASHVVVLVPEALASAQAGIALRRAKASSQDDGPVQYVTFDIGAGTFDACLIEDDAGAPDWRLLQHFGVALGGADLDQSLLEICVQLLKTAGRRPAFRSAFEIVSGFDEAGSAERSLLSREIESSKARLSRELRERGRGFEWTSGELSICLGVPHDPGNLDAWPVRFKPEAALRDITVPGDLWSLTTQASPIYGQELRLRIRSEFFASPQVVEGPLGQMTRLLGRTLPEMALALCTVAQRKVVVTGRAALWPPLYAELRASAERAGATLAEERPLSPRDMKMAVIEGAKALAARSAQLAEYERDVSNPLAMLTFGHGVVDGALSRGRVLQKVVVLPRPGEEPKRVDVRATFVVASIIPGLDREEGLRERLELFEQIRERYNIKPYRILSYDLPPSTSKGVREFLVSASGAPERIDFHFEPARGQGEPFTVSIQRQGRFYG